MAPSSTPSEGSRRSLLAARDARQAAVDRHAGAGAALVALSLAIPGEDKSPPGALSLFAWARDEVLRALPDARPLAAGTDPLGPFALWAVPGAPSDAKTCCIDIEAARPVARLVDLDVYAPGGSPVDRASLGRPPRGCLCCERPARECIALRRHGFAELVASARELLARE